MYMCNWLADLWDRDEKNDDIFLVITEIKSEGYGCESDMAILNGRSLEITSTVHLNLNKLLCTAQVPQVQPPQMQGIIGF